MVKTSVDSLGRLRYKLLTLLKGIGVLLLVGGVGVLISVFLPAPLRFLGGLVIAGAFVSSGYYVASRGGQGLNSIFSILLSLGLATLLAPMSHDLPQEANILVGFVVFLSLMLLGAGSSVLVRLYGSCKKR